MSSRALAVPFSQIFVATLPGSITDTSIPQGRSSRRSESLTASIPNFDAAYGPDERQRDAAADRADVDDAPASLANQDRGMPA